MWLGMDLKKVERVRRSMQSGDYVHPAFLISTIETGFDRFSGQLMRDMNEVGAEATRGPNVSEASWLRPRRYRAVDCLIGR